MRISGSQTGISRARLRFSHLAVPTGQVPSTGNALTGEEIALARQHDRRDLLHEIGRPLRHNEWPHVRSARFRRNLNLVEIGQSLVYQFAVPPHHLRPAFAVRLFDELLDARDCLLARQDARMPKKHVCMIVLMRPPIPACFARA